MAITLVTITCTTCGGPMQLPEHVPLHDERLCGDCTRALLRMFAKEVDDESSKNRT